MISARVKSVLSGASAVVLALSLTQGIVPRPATSQQVSSKPGVAASTTASHPAIVDPNRSGITYQGSSDKRLGMALGGLGTATLELGRNGAFQNVRVQNQWTGAAPVTPPGSFLSIHTRTHSGRTAARVLQLDGSQGLTPVKALTYTGRFPLVEIAYQDEALPCQVTLEALSPFVPRDAAASSLPLVFFTFRLRNPNPEPVTASVAISWVNNIGDRRPKSGEKARDNENSVLGDREPAVWMTTRAKELAGSEYLLACLSAPGVRYQAVADWCKDAPGPAGPGGAKAADDPVASWRCFLDRGVLPEQSAGKSQSLANGHRPAAAVSGSVELKPGETREVRFALVWFFPYHNDYGAGSSQILLGHQYAVRFPKGTRDVAQWAFPRRQSLVDRSLAWRPLIEQSSLPPHCRALMCEVLYLLPRISWWLADGTFVLHESIDCPRINATILDIYTAPVLSALFPELHASSLRAIAAAGRPDGEIPSTLGIGNIQRHEYRLFNSGDVSVFPIVTAWEILWGGDRQFATDMYPVLKRVLQWGARELDVDGDGIPDVHGIDQGWDTFPMFGAASYIADQWIAALLAGEKLARRYEDQPFADWCAAVRRKASATAENALWNGKYYDLANDIPNRKRSDICFADQFTYGTVAAGILGLGDPHPRDRVRTSLEHIWRLNVKPCKFVCRMGSNADGSPADQTVHKQQQGAASQSNAFTPVSTAPLAAAAIQYGMVDEGLQLAEATAEVIIQRVQEPWSGLLLFDSRTGDCFYGLHYSDCLILWDVMYALLGVQVDAIEGRLELAPPRIPVRMPLFSRLFTGQVEFATTGGVELRLTNVADQPASIRTLAVRFPRSTAVGRCSVLQGHVGRQTSGPDGQMILTDVVIPAKGSLRLQGQPIGAARSAHLD